MKLTKFYVSKKVGYKQFDVKFFLFLYNDFIFSLNYFYLVQLFIFFLRRGIFVSSFFEGFRCRVFVGLRSISIQSGFVAGWRVFGERVRFDRASCRFFVENFGLRRGFYLSRGVEVFGFSEFFFFWKCIDFIGYLGYSQIQRFGFFFRKCGRCDINLFGKV